jgi:hypothetical protein
LDGRIRVGYALELLVSHARGVIEAGDVARLQQLLAYLLQELPAAQPAAEAVIVGDVDNGEVDGLDEWDEDDSNDLEFYDDSGISPAVRLQRLQTRRSLLESSVELMLDSAVHSLVFASALAIRALKDVNLEMQHAAPSCDTLASLNTLHKKLDAIIDSVKRSTLLNPARLPLSSALSPQPPSLVLTASVSRNTDDKLHVVMASLTPVYGAIQGTEATTGARRTKAQTPADVEAALWKTVCDKVADAANAAVTTFNKRVRPAMSFAERRHIASLHQTSPASLDSICFSDLLEDSSAFPFGCDGLSTQRPWTWRDYLDPVDGIAADALGLPRPQRLVPDDSHLDSVFEDDLILQWEIFKEAISRHDVGVDSDGARAAAGSPRCNYYITKGDKKCPAKYWLRTRKEWPDLAEIMLFWLTTPISTACLERGFSFMTQMDSNARRCRMKEPSFRADFMAHLLRPHIRSQLLDAVRGGY